MGEVESASLIETPAAVMMVRGAAPQEVQCFSLGHNESDPYTLAMTGRTPSGRLLYAHHPAILRMIRQTWSRTPPRLLGGICGEAGPDLTLTETFRAWVDELSVFPAGDFCPCAKEDPQPGSSKNRRLRSRIYGPPQTRQMGEGEINSPCHPIC